MLLSQQYKMKGNPLNILDDVVGDTLTVNNFPNVHLQTSDPEVSLSIEADGVIKWFRPQGTITITGKEMLCIAIMDLLSSSLGDHILNQIDPEIYERYKIIKSSDPE